MITFLIFSCSDKEVETPPEVSPINATIRLLSAINNSPIGELPVYSDVDTTAVLTEEDGTASVPVYPYSKYSITAGNDEHMSHIYQGIVAAEPFEIIGYISDLSTTESVFNYLNIDLQQGTGIVVVAMDKPDLSPATGASASISTIYEEHFIFGQTLPEIGNTLIENGASFVSFANVELGETMITVTPPEGVHCRSFPDGEFNEDIKVDVYASTVTVAVFQCE
jgi:hypothetical protein